MPRRWGLPGAERGQDLLSSFFSGGGLLQPFVPPIRRAFGQGLKLLHNWRQRFLPRMTARRLNPRFASGAMLIGFFRAECGVGEAARRLFFALRNVNYPVTAVYLSSGQFEERDTSIVNQFTEHSAYRYNIFHVNANDILLRPSLFRRHGLRGGYRIGVWAWELARFPNALSKAFDQVDEVWVPSQFVYDAVAPVSPKPVIIIPHAVPCVEAPTAFGRSYFGIDPDAFVILIAFDLNSFIARKNPHGAIEAVRRAFAGAHGRNVQLVIKLHGRGFAEARNTLVEALHDIDKPIVMDCVLTREEMTGLQTCCDVFLSLHRSEGFGLNIAECMALGKCVIATNYSSNLDYFDKTCGAPVSYSLVPVQPSEYIFPHDQWWAEPNIDEAAELLRRAADDPQWRLALGRAARVRIRDQLSYDAIGRKVVERLSTLDAELYPKTVGY
jgi:glycosyltransferase involved in cell wall biosynthesis